MVSATRELLAERYHLEERIATGGMGVVWRARDHRLGRDVAIKLIRPEYADDPTFRERLRLEARAIAAINSPHVVRIHDVCEEKDPAGGCRAFIVMELVEGRPLSALLREGALTSTRTAAIIGAAASALAAAHEQQIIHRDIKPANLMVDANDQVTVLDFGIARAADAVALTATDLILGTARYIAPEQADGRGAGSPSDVYSLGVVAYECLAGTVPFDAGSDVAIALAHLRNPIPKLPAKVPRPMSALVRQMLAKTPADRPTAAEVAQRLGSAFGSLDTETGAATIVLPEAGVGPGTSPERTAVMPSVVAAGHRLRDRLAARDLHETRSATLRSKMMFVPAAAIVLALLIALAASSGSKGLQPSAAAGTPTTHATHRPAKVTIDPTRYVGREWPAVRAELKSLGVVPAPQFAGTGIETTVVGLAPTGKVEKGGVVTVVVSRSGPAHHANPAPKPVTKKPHPKHGPPPPHVPPGQAKKHDK
ncbi:MAG TPA: serine/threonine-protein kinase [Mycobacteriales bacterium]|nr:serine/threonine-protein kinase [Mycobacteriales bacterium]